MSLAQYKQFKKTSDEDKDRGLINAHKAGLAGVAAGLLLGRGQPAAAGAGKVARAVATIRTTRTRRAIAGYVAGQTAVHGTRVLTEPSKDAYGDRSRAAKHIEKLPMWAGLAGAGLLAKKRWANHTLADRSRIILFSGIMDAIRGMAGNKSGLRSGLALAGGITAADAATNAIIPNEGESHAHAAARGLGQGAIYGSILAGAEPVLDSLIKRRAKVLARRLRPIFFHYGEQPRRKDSQVGPDGKSLGKSFISPHKAWAENIPIVTSAGADAPEVPIRAGMLVKSAYRTGRSYATVARRGHGLVSDTAGALRGEKKMDERGRPMKREWEKQWFKTAVTGAALGAGLLGVQAARRHARLNPGSGFGKTVTNVEDKVVGAKDWVRNKTGLAARLRGMVLFDSWAEEKGWDVRDPRGRSARVFAPGSRPRERREKKNYETVGFLRKAAVIGGVGALGLGLGAGYLVGRPKGVVQVPRPHAGAVASPGELLKQAAAGGGGAPARSASAAAHAPALVGEHGMHPDAPEGWMHRLLHPKPKLPAA